MKVNIASIRARRYAEVSTLEVMVARVLGVDPTGPLGRRLVAKALSRM